jgi:tetratricopeptide (TPR) repeat protein
MIQHIFESMSEALEEIKTEFPNAIGPRKEELMTQLSVLRSMSDTFIEEWLSFEEKLGLVREACRHSEATDTDESAFIGNVDDVGEEWMEAYRRGQGYYQLLMYPKAAEEFEQVTQKEPEFVMGRLYLALSYLNKGQWDDSRRQLNLVLGTAQHVKIKALAHNAMGCILAKENQMDGALKHFEESAEQDGNFYDPVFNQAICLLKKEMVEEAAERCRKFLSEKDNDWECMVLLAQCYEKMGHMDKALSWRQVAMKVSGNVKVTLDLAQFYERSMEFQKAADAFEKVLGEQPNSAEAYHGLGWCKWILGEKEAGNGLIMKALTLRPNHVSYLFSLGWIQIQEQNWDEAEKILYKILEIDPDHMLTLAALSRLNTALGYFEAAKDAAHRLIDLSQGDSIGLGCYQMGCVFMEEANYESAVSYFDDAIQKNVAVKESNFYKGLCHYMLGNRDFAESSWKNLKGSHSLPIH